MTARVHAADANPAGPPGLVRPRLTGDLSHFPPTGSTGIWLEWSFLKLQRSLKMFPVDQVLEVPLWEAPWP